MNLTQRLLAGSLAVVTLFAAIAIALVASRVDRRSTNEVVAQLTREARLIASRAPLSSDNEALAQVASELSGRRVTIIAPTGEVLGDSELSLSAAARVENQRQKPDVRAAFDSNRVTSAVYPFGGQSMLHVSLPLNGNALRVSVPANQPHDFARGVLRDLLIAGLISLIFAVLFAISFARSVSRPVIELRDVTRAIVSGDLSRRAPIGAPGEVGELSRAIHTLSSQLASRSGALRDEEAYLAALVHLLYEGVVAVNNRRQVVRINSAAREMLHIQNETPFSTDLLPRHRLLREALSEALAGATMSSVELEVEGRQLALSARPFTAAERQGETSQSGAVLAFFDMTQLRRLERVRQDFVANVSHELRTPLTIIGGFAETLAEPDVPPDKRREFAELIRSNAVRMQHLVDDLLDLARIESGRWSPMPATLQVEDAISECIAQARQLANDKGLSLEYSVAEDAREVVADPTALRQILTNLLENAIRFTSVGTVRVAAVRAKDGVRLSVQDTGIGIPPEHLPRIFERFYRVDSGRARDSGGTGLGLAIVKHMAEAHGGSVSATSTTGEGTTVSVVLPNHG